MIRIKKAISLFAAIAMLCSMFVGAPIYVRAEGQALELVVNPVVLLPEKINSANESDRTITVDVNAGVTRPWKTGDALTVEVLRHGEIYSIAPTSVDQAGEAITVILPQTDITNVGGFDKRGGYSVNVKLSDVMLGTGYLEIDNVSINNIEIKEGEDRIHVNGTGLISLKSPNLYAEVYQGVNKISTSKRSDFIWGNFEFEFGGTFDLSTSYTLKLFDGGTDMSGSLPSGGVFTVTPLLVCSNNSGSPIISGNADATLVIADRNNLWTESETLNIQINGPNGGYEITGLTASEDNVQFTTSSEFNHTYPWPVGMYNVRIKDSIGVLLGVSQFYVGTSNNILQGEVKNSAGNLVASCGNVKIEKIEDGGYTSWQRQVLVLPDGKFYLPNNELSDGNYKASIAAPNNLQEADAIEKFSVAGGAITPNPIVLQFQLPNISGTVKFSDGTNCNISVPISLFDNSEMNNEINKIWTKPDGTFFIKINTSGTYYLKAWPDRLQAIPSSAKEIVYDGTSQTGIILQFQDPQIVVTAKDPTGSALTPNNFRIDIEPLDDKNWMHDLAIYQNQYLAGNMAPGQYNVYACPEGDSGYSRSFPQKVTITETNPATPITLDISLTNTKLTGTVTGMTGRDGYVALYKKTYRGFERIGSFNVNDVGSYKIGGIDNGSYYLRAELYSNSFLRGSNGPSLMTPVTITDTPSTQDLVLGNTTPRILYVSDMQNGEGKVRVRVVNINGITRNPTENDSLRAEIVKLDGSSFSPKIEVFGANNFMIRWDSMDMNNNEAEIEINMPKDINIPVGTYKLNLYDIKAPVNTGDDVLIAPDLTDGNKLEVLTGVETSKYGFFPSKTGQHTVVKAYGETQPWTSNDTIDAIFVTSNGLETVATVAIQADNTLDITVPSLAEGKYDMMIKKDGKLLVRQYIEVGTPEVTLLSSPSDMDANLTIEGQYMSVLIGSGAIIKIYSGGTLVRTVQKMWNMWGNLEAEYFEPLPVGDYTVKVWAGAEDDANLLTLPNGGALKVIKSLKSSKPCVLNGYPNGTTQTLSVYKGSVPWIDNQDLALKLINEWEKENVVINIPLSDDNAVSTTDLSFQLPDDSKLAHGKWRIEVYSGVDLIARGHFDIINSSEVAYSGTITGAEGGNASGAKIIMESQDRKNYYEFYADANGSYKAYWIDNPGIYNVWIEPKETDPFMKSASRELTIDGFGHCATPIQNFVLPAARLISGTVNLPSGSASSNMEFWVNGFSENGTPTNKDDDFFGESEGKIAIGSSSGSYVVKVPKAATSGYYLQLYVKTDAYIGNYYYGSGAAKYSLNEATIVDVSSGDQSGKNFTLEVGRKIQGNITIPDTITIPPEGYNLEVFALMDNATSDIKKDDWYIGNKITLTSSTKAYTFCVPANLNGKPYKIGYNADPYGMLELGGYYASGGTVYDDGATADPVDVSAGDVSSINLTARIRTDTEKRAGFIAALVNKIGADKFAQPTVDEISEYSSTYSDWGSMLETQKTAMAIAVKNGIVKGTVENKICPNEFVTRATSVVILARATYALGARMVETQPNIYFDDIKEHWARDDIHNMARAGVISGYQDGRFYPDLYFLSQYTDGLLTNYASKLATANATRAGVVASVINGLGKIRFTLPTEAEISGYATQYTDWSKIPASMTYPMAIAVKNSMIMGNTEGMLLPNEKVSRAEVSVLLCNILKNATPVLTLKQVRSAPSFFDIPAEHWAKPSIDSLYRANVINGISTSTFAPNQAVTNSSIGPLVQSLFGGIYVAPAVITLQPASQTVTYGTASVTLSVTATGENISYKWKKGGVAIDGATASTYTINNPVPSDSGIYTVEIRTGTDPLFALITCEQANLIVEPKQLTVEGLTAENKIYNGTTAAVVSGTATLTGIVGTDDVTLTGEPTAVFSDKNASDGKTVNVSGYILSGNDIAKYVLVQPVLSANISKVALTATADDKQRAFGVANPTFTITYNGFISGESVANSGITQPGITCTATTLSPGGAYAITLTGGSGGTNYTLSLVNGTLAVVPGLPNVTFSFDGADANKLKGSTTAMEYSIDGGTTWTDCTVDTDLTAQLSNISAQNDIKVREKAVTGPPAVPAGVVLTIDILAAPAAPSLTVNFTSEKIMNATTLMEYKIDSGAYQTVSSTEAALTTGGIDLSPIIPASGSGAKVLTIRVKSKGRTLSGVVQAINIPARAATPSAPTVATAGLTPTSVTLSSSAGLEYKRDNGVWQNSTVFTGLTTGVAYSFKQHVKATATEFASDNSAELLITYHTVSFVPNGGSSIPPVQTVIKGNPAQAPGSITKTGYTGGTSSDWYSTQDLSGIAYDFASGVSQDTTLYAKWIINKYEVTSATAGGIGGVISPAAQKVAYGDNLTLTVLPNVGYELTGFKVNGSQISLSSILNGKYLLSNITANTSVEGTFSKRIYTITKSIGNQTDGSITANNTAEYGSSLLVTIVPAQDKKIGNVEYIMGGVTVKPTLDELNQFTIASVTGPVTINAAFADVDKSALKTAIINALSMNPEPYLDSVKTTFKSALASAILVLTKTSATEQEVLAATTVLTDAADDLIDTNKKTFSVTVIVPDASQGQATVDKISPMYGENVAITATPVAGYILYKILVNGIQLNGNIINNVSSNVVVTVLFKSTIPQEVIDFKANHTTVLGRNITTVTTNDSAGINAALTAYSGLNTDNQKHLAVDYQLLKALRVYLDNKTKADEVIAEITALSDDARNLTFVSAVNSVIAKYFSLTPDQQKLVGIVNIYYLNKYKLEADVIFQKDLVDTARTNHVNGLIGSLYTTIGQGGDYANVADATIAYNAAKTAYDSLSTDLKSQITTTKLTALKTAIDSANQAAALTVQTQINALTVVLSNMSFDAAEGYKKAIIEAKNAYDALTESQKAYVNLTAKAKLTECFESVAVIIEKLVEGLDTSVSFTGISDKVSDMTVAPADQSKEAAVNQKLNTDGADTARRTDMVISITLKNSSDQTVQPDGKVVMKIKISADIKNRKPKIMSLDSESDLFEVPSRITGSDANGWYIEFETDHFSDYAVVSAVQNNNANLSELALDGITLSPVFDKNTTSYTASVANTVTSTVVNHVVEDTGKATATGSGTWSLSVGANTKNIVVTAEDGTTKTYTVTVTRASDTISNGDNSGSPSNNNTTTPNTATDTNNQNKTKEPVISKDGNTTIVSISPQLNNTTGEASAAIDVKTVESLIAMVKVTEGEGQKAVVGFKVQSSYAPKSVSIDIQRDAFNKIVTETKADVKIEAGLGTITFNSKALKQISQSNEGDISISVRKVEESSLSTEIKSKVGERPVYDFSVKAGNNEITKFGDGAAMISIPYTLKSGEKENAVVVYYIDGKGKLITVRGRYDEATKTVNFKTNHFSWYAVGYNEVKFKDVSASAWYNKAVEFIAARGITTGTGSGNYEPDSKLTRGQYIVMIMKAYGIEPLDNPTDNFADSGNAYYTNYLAAAKKLGITKGVGDNMYAPVKEITRQEMFTLLYNTLKAIGELPEAREGKAAASFSDYDKIAPWAMEAMTLFVKAQIVSGNNGRLTPQDTSNRAQMAQVIYNLLIK